MPRRGCSAGRPRQCSPTGAPTRWRGPHGADRTRTPEPLERGPIVLCLDTSGSMRGAPEHIAKAVAIAALRVAHEARPRLPADRLRRPGRTARARPRPRARGPAGAAGPDGPELRRRHRRADARSKRAIETRARGALAQRRPADRQRRRVRLRAAHAAAPGRCARALRPARARRAGRRPRDDGPARGLRPHPLGARLAAPDEREHGAASAASRPCTARA